MSTTRPAIVEHADAELVFALVAPLGVNLNDFVSKLKDELRAYGYETDVVRLSSFLKMVEPADGSWNLVEKPEETRLDAYMTAGDRLREESGRNDILALMAASEIARQRSSDRPVPGRRAHVLVSLKHPDEVLALREIYDAGFYLLGLYTPEAERLRYLIDVKSLSKESAEKLIQRDDDEAIAHGQQTRDAFQLADVFIRADGTEAEQGLTRFLRLVFGDPRVTPTADEHAMFLAYSTSLRSGALGRQVGAVIVSAKGDVVAVGANDVPKFGGGQYWPGADDARDHVLGHDSNATQRDEIIEDVVTRISQLVDESDEARTKIEAAIRKSRIVDITEYGREVHAEMEALLSCARAGGETRDSTLFTTTFPCHNCAKHIVGAGVARVVFVEPYPKSKALELHRDSLTLEESEVEKRIWFRPFVGIGPTRFLDLFSLRLGRGSPLRRKSGNIVAAWRKEGASPRVQMGPMSYLDREAAAQGIVAKVLPANS